jgi:O-phosphoseryl-tRNA(Cys) synthetase
MPKTLEVSQALRLQILKAEKVFPELKPLEQERLTQGIYVFLFHLSE